MLSLAPPPTAGRLCVIGDETGSGKTEAALIHFFGAAASTACTSPCRRGQRRQIHSSMSTAVWRRPGPQAPPRHPGRAGLSRPGRGEFGRPGNAVPRQAADVRRDALWSSERPKTIPNQLGRGRHDRPVLLGGLRVRHVQLRSGAMRRLLLVIDEVHGSDIYVTAILRNLLDQHRRRFHFPREDRLKTCVSAKSGWFLRP